MLTDIVQGADVWMIQSGYGPRLSIEPLRELGVYYLDGDLAFEPRVARLVPRPSRPRRVSRGCGKSVFTSLAGFAETGWALAPTAGSSDAESVITFMAGFNAAGLVITSMAGFACGGQPHPPGGRTAIPASFK